MAEVFKTTGVNFVHLAYLRVETNSECTIACGGVEGTLHIVVGTGEQSHEISEGCRRAVLLELYTGGVTGIELRLHIVQANNLVISFALFLCALPDGLCGHTACDIRHGQFNHFLKVGVAQVGKCGIVFHQSFDVAHRKRNFLGVRTMLNLIFNTMHESIFLVLALLVLLTVTYGVGVRYLCNWLLFTL